MPEIPPPDNETWESGPPEDSSEYDGELTDNISANPTLHVLREHAEDPENLSTVSGKGVFDAGDLYTARGYIRVALDNMDRVEKLNRVSGNILDAMERMLNNVDITTNKVRQPEQTYAELKRNIRLLLDNFDPECFKQYDEFKTSEGKKKYVRENMGRYPELRDPYFAISLLRQFGNDGEFSIFVMNNADFKHMSRDSMLEFLLNLPSSIDPAVADRLASTADLADVWNLYKNYKNLLGDLSVYDFKCFADMCKEIPKKIEGVLSRIRVLPREKQALFVRVLVVDYISSKDCEEIFKDSSDTAFFFEIYETTATAKSGKIYANAAMESFNHLYEYGPDRNGNEDQIRIAATLSGPLLANMLGARSISRVLNCSHRELTSALCRKKPEEIMAAIESLPPDSQEHFFTEMVRRSRLPELASVVAGNSELTARLGELAAEKLSISSYSTFMLAGIEVILQIPTVGELIFKRTIAALENKEKEGNSTSQEIGLRKYLLVRFEKYAEQCGVALNPNDKQETQEKIEEATHYDAQEALSDKIFSVATLFTTDMRNRSNSRRDLWMQNSDFLRTYKSLLGEGYALTDVLYKNGRRDRRAFSTDKEADVVREATLVKTRNGIRMVQRLVKSENAYADMTRVLNDDSTDMIVQRGHCWDAEESFLGSEAQKETAKESLPEQNPSRRKLVIIGGCYQASKLAEFEAHMEGQNSPYFVATSKTGKGAVTIPLTIEYADAIVDAAAGNQIINMEEIDGVVKKKTEKLFKRIPESDGYIFVTSTPNILRAIGGKQPAKVASVSHIQGW